MGIENEKIIDDPLKYFYFHNRRIARSLNEFIAQIPNLKKEDFSYHVTTEKNDFAQWVDLVVGDKEMAEKIASCNTLAELKEKMFGFDPFTVHADKRITDEEAFASYHDEETEKKDAVVDKFDAVLQKMKEEKETPVDENIMTTLEKLQEHEKILREKISDARKKGKDPLMAEFSLRMFPGKLALAKVSQDPQEVVALQSLLHNVEEELTELEEPLNIKKEIQELINKTSNEKTSTE